LVIPLQVSNFTLAPSPHGVETVEGVDLMLYEVKTLAASKGDTNVRGVYDRQIDLDSARNREPPVLTARRYLIGEGKRI
jgi:hypothetical protein